MKRGVFIGVLGIYQEDIFIDEIGISTHNCFRLKRLQTIENEICSWDEMIIDMSFVELDEQGRKTIHCITDKGVILVLNESSKLLVTTLIGTRNQVSRYYDTCNIFCPKYIMRECRKHERRRMNWIKH